MSPHVLTTLESISLFAVILYVLFLMYPIGAWFVTSFVSTPNCSHYTLSMFIVCAHVTIHITQVHVPRLEGMTCYVLLAGAR